ncbi:MAG: hypothetical protein VB091_09745 [Christensenella sp.]|nr:hypothetical protein [Christensenella sp.]
MEDTDKKDSALTEVLNWISKHRIFTALGVLLVFLIPIISVLYIKAIFTTSFFDEIGLSPDALITYTAGFEAFLGTVVLGITANEMNKRLIKNEETHRRFERQPSIMVLSAKNNSKQTDASKFDMKFNVINVSNVSTQFKFESLSVGDKFNILKRSNPSHNGIIQMHAIGFLKPQEEHEYGFEMGNVTIQADIIYPCVLVITMINSIGELYTEIVRFSIKLISDGSVQISEYTYKIGKTGGVNVL